MRTWQRTGTPRFGFIVHPRSAEDMLRAKRLSLLRAISANDADFVARVQMLPPMVVGEVGFGFDPFHGDIVSIPHLPADVTTDDGREAILAAARMAIDGGARIIGLGALTSPATGGGEWLVQQLPADVKVTNGNAYTAAVLRRHVLDVTARLSPCRRACVAIVGCAGSVGSALSRLLDRSGVDLLLVGRRVSQVRRLLEELSPSASLSETLADVRAADVVVVLTSAASARLSPDQVRRGAIVIDAAEPANVSDADALEWRDRMTVLHGGRVRIPGYHCTYDFGLADPRETFACLAETYLCARDGIWEHSVGTPSPEFAERLDRAAARHGVQPSWAADGDAIHAPQDAFRRAQAV